MKTLALLFALLYPFVCIAQVPMQFLADQSSSGGLRAIATNSSGTIISIGSLGTILRSTNGGNSWESVHADRHYDFRSLVYHNGYWCAAGYGTTSTGSSIVFLYSDNDGNDWQEAEIESSIQGLLFAHLTTIQLYKGSQSLWAVTAGGAILESTTNGTLWTLHNAPNTGSSFRNVALTQAPDGALHYVDDQGYWYQQLGSVLWTKRTIPVTGDVRGISYHQDTFRVVILEKAGEARYRLGKSIDNGVTWDFTSGQTLNSISRFVWIPAIGFVGVGGWQTVGIALPNSNGWDTLATKTFFVANDVTLYNNSLLLCGNRKSLFSVNLSTRAVERISYVAFRNPEAVTALGILAGSELYFAISLHGRFNTSSDNGTTWQPSDTIYPNSKSICGVHVNPDGSAILLTDEAPFMYTRGIGSNVWKANTDLNAQVRRRVDNYLWFPEANYGMFLSTDANNIGAAMVTTDMGSTWTARKHEGSDMWLSQYIQDDFGRVLSAISYDRDSPTSTLNTSLLISTNDGNSWVKNIIDTNLGIQQMVTFSRNVIVVIGRTSAPGEQQMSRIYRTVDGGASWQILYKQQGYWFSTLCSTGDTCIALCKNSDKLFISTNRGEDWNSKKISFSGVDRDKFVSFRSSVYHNGSVYAAGSFGDTAQFLENYVPLVVRIPIANTVTSTNDLPTRVLGLPNRITLYPQPAKETLTVVVPQATVLSARIYNATFQNVQNISHTLISAQSSYQQFSTIQLDELPSGVYSLVIQTKEQTLFSTFVVKH